MYRRSWERWACLVLTPSSVKRVSWPFRHIFCLKMQNKSYLVKCWLVMIAIRKIWEKHDLTLSTWHFLSASGLDEKVLSCGRLNCRQIVVWQMGQGETFKKMYSLFFQRMVRVDELINEITLSINSFLWKICSCFCVSSINQAMLSMSLYHRRIDQVRKLNISVNNPLRRFPFEFYAYEMVQLYLWGGWHQLTNNNRQIDQIFLN